MIRVVAYAPSSDFCKRRWNEIRSKQYDCTGAFAQAQALSFPVKGVASGGIERHKRAETRENEVRENINADNEHSISGSGKDQSRSLLDRQQT